MTETTEFSHIVRLDAFPTSGEEQHLVADEKERAALAKRFDLPEISKLSARFQLARDDDVVTATGTLDAQLQQQCAISGEPFALTVDEPFALRFEPRDGEPAEPGEEIELSDDDCDVIEYENGSFDLGEAIAQTLYLALDSYPVGPDAAKVRASGKLASEEEAGPFGALAALKDKLAEN